MNYDLLPEEIKSKIMFSGSIIHPVAVIFKEFKDDYYISWDHRSGETVNGEFLHFDNITDAMWHDAERRNFMISGAQ